MIDADYIRMVKDKFPTLLTKNKVLVDKDPMYLFSRDFIDNLPTLREKIFFTYYSRRREAFPIDDLDMKVAPNVQLFAMYVKMFGITPSVSKIIFEHPNFLPLLQPGMFEAIFTEKEEEIATDNFISVSFPYISRPEMAVVKLKDRKSYETDIKNLLEKTNSNVVINAIRKNIEMNKAYFAQKFFK